MNFDYEEFKKHIYCRDRIPVVEPMVEPLQMELERQTLEEMKELFNMENEYYEKTMLENAKSMDDLGMRIEKISIDEYNKRQTLEEMLKTNVTTAFEVPEDYLNDSYNDHQADIFRYAISQINKGDSKMNKNQIAFSALIHIVMLALFATAIGEQGSGEVFTYFGVMKAYVLVMVFYWLGYATIKL